MAFNDGVCHLVACASNFDCTNETCPAVVGGGTNGTGAVQTPNPANAQYGLITPATPDAPNIIDLDQKVIDELHRRRQSETYAHFASVAPSPHDKFQQIRKHLDTLGLVPPNPVEYDPMNWSDISSSFTQLNVSTAVCVCDSRCDCNSRVSDCFSRCQCDCECENRCICNADGGCECNTNYPNPGCSCLHRCNCDSQFGCLCDCFGDCGAHTEWCDCDLVGSNCTVNCSAETSCGTNVGAGPTCFCDTRTSALCTCNMRCVCDTRCACDARAFV